MGLFNSHQPTTAEQIEREIHNLMAALDELKQGASKESRHTLDNLRARAEHLWEYSSPRLERMALQTRRAGQLANQYAHEHPWSTAVLGLGLIVGAATLVGLMLSRR